MRKFITPIQRDIIKRHIGPFIFCFLTFMFLMLMQFLINHIDKLVGKGLPWGVIIELIATNLAYMVVLAAPMSVLVASLMAYGRFSEYNEYAALTAAGVNPVTIIIPMAVIAVLMSIFLVWFSNNVLPEANQKARSLFIDIRMKKPGFDLEPNVFYDGIDDYTFLVKDMSAENDTLYDVTLFQEATRNKYKAVIKADKGHLQSSGNQILTLYLNDGTIVRYLPPSSKRNEMYEETSFNRYRLSFDLSEMAFSKSNPNKRRRSDRTMSAQAMMAVVDTLHKEIRQQINKHTRNAEIAPAEGPAPAEVSVDTTSRGADTSKSQQPGTVTDTTNVKSTTNFVVLQHINESDQRKELIQNARSGLRSMRSSIENLSVNLNWRNKRVNKYLVEIHKKYSIPFSCIVFLLVGATIGLLTRKGNLGYAALISAGLLTFNWISIIQGEKLADRMFVSPWLGMWFSNIVLGIIGLYLLLHITTSYKLSNLLTNRD